MSKIWVESIKELAQITAELSREGIVFEVWEDEFTKTWRIEIKGY